jgi:hypothetical protein
MFYIIIVLLFENLLISYYNTEWLKKNIVQTCDNKINTKCNIAPNSTSEKHENKFANKILDYDPE